MTAKLSYLRCEATPGQFADEVVIAGKDHSGEEFSLFANRQFVETEQAPHEESSVPVLLRVTELAKDGELVLIRLPSQTLANGQTITVRSEELEDAPAWQEA
ncbi:MAG: hypothetical protein WD872_17725 [Pirellulaceae bacterium]